MHINHTSRGFACVEFDDHYGQHCSLQKSSLADEDAIWFGVDNTGPHLSFPNESVAERGPTDVDVHVRMHLTREQVATLLPLLVRFVETGEIDEPERNNQPRQYASNTKAPFDWMRALLEHWRGTDA